MATETDFAQILERLEGRFDSLESKFDSQNEKLQSIDSRLARVEEKTSNISDQLTRQEGRVWNLLVTLSITLIAGLLGLFGKLLLFPPK
jgi:chromosome segregation ATPase